MENPSTSGFNIWESKSDVNSASLNLSVNTKIQMNDEEIEEDDLEEVEVDERDRLHLQKVSSLVEAAYQRVEKFSKHSYFVSSAGVSETSSCASTLHPAASLPESLDGGRAEVEELKNSPVSLESALRINQTLQRRLTTTLNRLEKTLQQNILRQVQLKEEEEEQYLVNYQDKDYRESRNKYFIRPSSFAIPYFKDRTGMPAPMNQDAKFKVDRGYLDLYSTRLRTWLTSEQNLLVREVQKEWKNQLINDWKTSLKTAERKLKNPLISEDERTETDEEIKTCQNHINFFTNVPGEKIDMPRGSRLDWDKVSAQAFDGYRSTEECQLLWENYMHPSINRSPWTEDEDIEIQETVLQSKNMKPDWEELASNLNTGRTSFQVMQRWVSFIKPTIQPARWTADASKKLEDTINMLRVGSHIPWSQVAQHLTGYTKIQLQSRWRNINPDQFKGPFTSEEDFVVIKGLYKFGMNFDIIAHFLPGRNRVQVRDRFKRALLPGLTSKPWNWREDKKIIANCSMDVQHWRRMAMLLPKRDTCQIRLRFYTLHFWQTVSKENKLPPPLFPLSMTRKAIEVKQLREKILKLNPDVKIYLDSIQNNKLQMDASPTWASIMKKKNYGICHLPLLIRTIVDLIFPEEFLVPCTEKSVRPFEERRAAICKTQDSKTLAKFLEEKLDDPVKPQLLRKRKRGRCGPRIQSWPDKALTEFFLPGRTTTASVCDPADETIREHFHRVSQALQLKVRKVVLPSDIHCIENIELDENDVKLVNEVLVFHHEIRDYGNECLSCAGQNPDIIPLMPPNLSTIGAFRSLLLHKPKLQDMASKEFLLFQVPRDQLHKLGTKPKTLNEKAVSEKIEISEEQMKNLAKKEGATTETAASNSNQSEEDSNENSSKPDDELASRRGKRKAAARAAVMNYVCSQEEKKGKLWNPVIKEVLEPPSGKEMETMQIEGECVCFRKRPFNAPKQEIIHQEDRLLFHRLLSLFFWPALFTLRKPSKEGIHLSNELAKERKLNEMDVIDVLYDPVDKLKKKTFAHLNMDEQEKMIKKMEAVKIQKQNQYKMYCKPDVELTQEDMKQRIFKKEIVKLKRSLVMKRAWEKRRLGMLPARAEKKVTSVSHRPRSARIASLQMNRKKQIEEEEKRLQMEQDLMEIESESSQQ